MKPASLSLVAYGGHPKQAASPRRGERDAASCRCLLVGQVCRQLGLLAIAPRTCPCLAASGVPHPIRRSFANGTPRVVRAAK